MKKIYALLLTLLMMFLLTACNTVDGGSGSAGGSQTISNNNSVGGSSGESHNDLNSSAAAGSGSGSSETESQPEQSSGVPESSNTSQSSSIPELSSQPEPEKPKILVAYFSATNTTKGVAERIYDALNADLYEITPEIPYTSADLNYHDNGSRSSVEMNDPNSRPAISGSVNNMEQYDIVFIGYPIWWGDAPRILSTFVESYSFSGKTVVPFCTSGGSGVGSSAKNLERLTSGAEWLSGTRLSGSASKDDIVGWINGLDITVE